jgi:Metallo-peptidase family M12B Reprolysin-like/Calx-beta domain
MQQREGVTRPLSRSRPVQLRGILLLFVGTATVAPGALGDQLHGRGRGGSEERQAGLWYPGADQDPAPSSATGRIQSANDRTLILDSALLADLLARAPLEATSAAKEAAISMDIPWPDGSLRRFQIEESPTMEPELAAQFPDLKTYAGRGIDDRTASMRFDWTPAGFHAMVLSADGTILIDPYSPGDTEKYIVYFMHDRSPDPSEPFRCGVMRERAAEGTAAPGSPLPPPHGATLRTYRLAVAATGEYTMSRGGGTVPGAMNAIVTTVNRVNLIFQRDLAVRLTLIADNASIIYTDAGTDPYDEDNLEAMLCQNAQTLDEVIKRENYDIGHVFATVGGGLAGPGVVCSGSNACGTPSGSVKAFGVSGIQGSGDAFDVTIAAHELAHQFGSEHTFNGTSGQCGATRFPSSAFEPASGSTVMSYPGNRCFPEGLQPIADAYFHADSLDRMITFVTNPATGGSCGPASATGNTPPTVNAGPDYTIPRGTPFVLRAIGTDADGDYLNYAWEEMDLGTASPPNGDDGTRPIFRSFLPTPAPARTFPQLSDILDNNTPTLGESLPTTTRAMKFRVTARDNRIEGGGTASDDMVLHVRAESGPFVVTQPNTAVVWPIGSSQTVTWNVANTAVPPVSCANVKISLSVDGGHTFPTVLAANTPNDGSEAITVPSLLTSVARIKIEAVGNVFFDISNVNFTINSSNSSLSIDDVTVPDPGGNPGTATFTVSLSPPNASLVTVAYQAANGTATAGSDYDPASGTLTFASGQTRKTIDIVVRGDALAAPSEAFFLNLSNPTNATITDGQGVGTIRKETCGVSATAVADGGFEAGSPWPAWPVQSSTQRGTPICQRNGSCGFGIDTYAGEYVAMFGARPGAETATLGQTVTLPVSISLTLRFQMRIITVSASPADTLVVTVDGVPARTFAEPPSPDSSYILRQVDLTPFADGGSHAILFRYSNAPPTSAFSTFLVDNVELFACPPQGVVNACVADGTFEGGTPWPAWTVQTSTIFGTPICNVANCGSAPPFAGGNWAWFGGVAAPEQSTLGQTITLAASTNPLLTFQMRVAGTAPPTDTLVVSVDGAPVQTFTEPTSPESEYSRRQIDLTAFADGGSHALLFTYNGPTSGSANFFVDNVELLCPPPRPSLSVNDVVLTEGNSPGTTTARFSVTLSGASPNTVTAAYATANNTATEGPDYVLASGTVTFPPGTTSRSIEVQINGDTVDETPETFFVNLSSPMNATISDGQGVATIEDDDLPPALSIDDVTPPEFSTATFTVTLSAASGQAVTVAYQTADGTAVAGSDYTTTSGTLSFLPGLRTRQIFVPVIGDTTDEPTEAFFVNLGSPTNATIADGQGVARITTPVSTSYYTLSPCRLVDTRGPTGPSGGPRLAANTTRTFPVTGLCMVPPDAKTIAVNLTVTGATELGNLRLYPAGAALPTASAINFAAVATRGNNGIFALGTGGQIAVHCAMDPGSTGGAHFILDVMGYLK